MALKNLLRQNINAYQIYVCLKNINNLKKICMPIKNTYSGVRSFSTRKVGGKRCENAELTFATSRRK